MKKEFLLLSIRDQVFSELENNNCYVDNSNAIYKSNTSIIDPRYKCLVPDEVKAIKDIKEGVYLNRRLVTKEKENDYKNGFVVDNEIYNNIFNYLLLLIKQEINLSVKHPLRLSLLSNDLGVLTDIGYEKFQNDIIPWSMSNIFRELDKFMCGDEWATYSYNVSGFGITIVKENDYRILEWERMQREKEENE